MSIAHGTDVLHRWIEPLGLVGMLVVALVLGLLVVRRHGRREQRAQARAERKHPFAAPGRTLMAFGVAFGSALGFVSVAREVAEGRTNDIDSFVELGVHSFDTPRLDVVMRGFTFLGSPFGVLPLAMAVGIWAVRRKETRAAAAFGIVLVMTEAINWMLKHTFERARPTLFQEIETLHSYSFPSGHAMAAAAIYGMIGVVVSRLAPRRRRVLVYVLPLLVLMIGISRIYLGVHWPSDVLAGFAAGAFIVLAGAITLDGIPTVAVRST
jgi:membrane-associated phospholipid phosphatase